MTGLRDSKDDVVAGNPPAVSVIVPAYNAGWSLARTLSSVLAQSYKNFEIIVVDDGSTDNTVEVVRDFARSDRRIKLILQTNKGVAAARNRALAESTGTYLAPLDSDDLWHPENLERQITALEAAGPEARFSFAANYHVDYDDNPTPGPLWPRRLRADYVTLLRRNWVGCGSAAIYRRDAVVAAGGFDESLKALNVQGAEDWLLTLKVASQGPGVAVSMPLVGYRVGLAGMSWNHAAMTDSVLRVIEIMRRTGPKVAPWHYWAARTSVLAWLLPRWVRARDWPGVFRCFVGTYVANPLWFTQQVAWDTLRLILAMLMRAVLKRLGILQHPKLQAGATRLPTLDK